MSTSKSRTSKTRRKPNQTSNSDIVSEFTKVLIDRILPHQGEDGAFLGDVYTYHFIEALTIASPVAFRAYINRALAWFEKLDDPRDKNKRSLSPFRLTALIGTPLAKDFQRAAVSKLLRFMVGREGNINLPIDFVETPNSFDPFPTLSGVLILLKSDDSKGRKAAANGLQWVLAHRNDITRPGTIGLLAFALLRAKSVGLEVDGDTLKKLVAELTRHARGREVLADGVQGAYVAFDLACADPAIPGKGLMATARKLVTSLVKEAVDNSEEFYKHQDHALLDLRLLAACGAVLTQPEREGLVERLLGTAFDEKVSVARQNRQLQLKNQELTMQNRRLMDLVDGRSLLVRPRWQAQRQQIDPKLVFVLMQFPIPQSAQQTHLVEMEKAFRDHLKPELESKLGLRVLRADDIFDTREIMQSIWDSLMEARIVLADLTNRNPNVFYEVGLADVLGKEIVFLSQKIEDVPFDLRNRRVILYEVTYDGINKLKKEVVDTIKNVLNGK